MHDLSILNTSVLTMSSLEIASLVKSRHSNVRISIERLVERGVILKPAVQFLDEISNLGLPIRRGVYNLDKRSSLIVVAQLSPEFTAKVVDRWQELEAGAISTPTTYIDALKALVVSEEAKQEAQRALAAEAPFAELGHAVSSEAAMVMRDWVAMMRDDDGLGATEKQVHAFLVEERYLYREPLHNRLRAYACYANLFTLVQEVIHGGIRDVLKITGDGMRVLTPVVLRQYSA